MLYNLITIIENMKKFEEHIFKKGNNKILGWSDPTW